MQLPSFVDWFGWCTWDAFYTDVTADGVKQGLRSLEEGGAPPRFLIIDDGWQQIGSEDKEEGDPSVSVQEGAQFASRLTGIKENSKFQSHKQEEIPGLKQLVEEAKKGHGVKSVYVWHAMAGYWGGVTPSAAGMARYEPALAYPVQSPGVTGNQPDIVMDSLSVLGLGLVHPRKAHTFYHDLHAYLAACGVDGVKVDVQNIIETLGAGHGGRVALTHAYHRALEASVARNFPDNGCISCMCHNTDTLYSAKQTAVMRASDDFYPRDPASHTIHISSVAYNTLFLGEFMHPDWDMFHVSIVCLPRLFLLPVIFYLTDGFSICRACTRRPSTTAPQGRSAAARFTSATSRGTTTSTCSRSSCSPTALCFARSSLAGPRATASSPIRRATAQGEHQPLEFSQTNF
jgi:raffinose synthase